MKYCLEFGVRGGAHKDNVIVPTRALAEELARTLVATFCNDWHNSHAGERDWLFEKGCTRKTWKNKTHVVAVSKLDGKARGSASATLWKKPNGGELLSDTVCSYYD